MKIPSIAQFYTPLWGVLIFTILTLPLFVQGGAEYDCVGNIRAAMRKMSRYVRPENSIYHLFPYIEDPESTGRLITVCKVYNEIKSDLKHTIYPNCPASDADTHLARIAGFEHICGTGQAEYGQFAKCIYESSSKLSSCKMAQDRLDSIKWEASYGSTDVKTNLCGDMHKYIQCSRDRIEKACGSSKAGQWYQSFITYVFEDIDHYYKLGCSFSKAGGSIGGNVTNIAIGVAIGVGILVLLFCLCWCCRVGVCGCCREEEEEDIKYHMPDNNDNEKDPSVHSIV